MRLSRVRSGIILPRGMHTEGIAVKLAAAAIALVTSFGLAACEGMAPGGYGDMPTDPNIAAAQATIPQLPPPPGGGPGIPPPPMPRPPSASPSIPMPTTGGPSQTSKPPTAPAPAGGSTQATGGPLNTPKPPTAPAPTTPAYRPACSAPNIVIRTEASGGVEIKCGAPPSAPPASLKCTAPDQLTYLTRNGVSNFVCMK
jgi:hypothetical protein